MRWDSRHSRMQRLERVIPPMRRLDPGMCELLEHLERQYGGVRERGRLTAVNFADGRRYPLDSDGDMTPDLAHAILTAAGR